MASQNRNFLGRAWDFVAGNNRLRERGLATWGADYGLQGALICAVFAGAGAMGDNPAGGAKMALAVAALIVARMQYVSFRHARDHDAGKTAPKPAPM